MLDPSLSLALLVRSFRPRHRARVGGKKNPAVSGFFLLTCLTDVR